MWVRRWTGTVYFTVQRASTETTVNVSEANPIIFTSMITNRCEKTQQYKRRFSLSRSFSSCTQRTIFTKVELLHPFLRTSIRNPLLRWMCSLTLGSESLQHFLPIWKHNLNKKAFLPDLCYLNLIHFPEKGWLFSLSTNC
jgi:hypothetical protein